MKHSGLHLALLFLLAACEGAAPNPSKTAHYNPDTGALALPNPCPDWSDSNIHNYTNTLHSNFGCAVNKNAALQLDNPADLHHGHGASGPDTEISAGVVKQYRAGDIPQPLSPLQSTGSE